MPSNLFLKYIKMSQKRAIMVLLGLAIASMILFFVYMVFIDSAFGSSEQLIEGIKYKVTIYDGVGTKDTISQP